MGLMHSKRMRAVLLLPMSHLGEMVSRNRCRGAGDSSTRASALLLRSDLFLPRSFYRDVHIAGVNCLVVVIWVNVHDGQPVGLPGLGQRHSLVDEDAIH